MTPERLVFVGTSDLAGLLRGKSFPLAEMSSRLVRGVGITHSNLLLSVFGPIYDTPFGTAGDLVLVPDPATIAPIPMADGPDADLLLGDFLTTDGAPWECCPRHFLRHALGALHRETGLTLLAAFEQELVYTGVEERLGSPYSLEAFRSQGAFGGALMAAMRRAGIEPDSFLAEYGPRQYEVTVAPAPGVQAADHAVVVRELARAVAAKLGHRAILAPMLHPDGTGNGTHIHWSLQDDAGQPATHDGARPHGLSLVAEQFTAGILHHMPALTALTTPSAASFFRLRPGRWAPTLADFGVQDRGVSLRVCPVYAGAPETVARQFNVEYRVADAAASPYIALGALVHAGLDGIRSRRMLAQTPAAPLPASLAEALDRLEASAAARSWFSPQLRDIYLRAKRAELKALDGLDDAEICERYAAIY
jgi:glutamine synthetase